MMFANNQFMQLLRYASVSKFKVTGAILCSILNKICDIVPEILIGVSIDVVVHQQESVVAKLFGVLDPYQQLYWVGALTAALWILESIFEYLYTIIWCGLARDVQHVLRLRAYAAVQNLDYAKLEGQMGGGLLSILHDDINQLEEFLSEGPNQIIQLVVNVVVMGVLFLYLSPVLAGLTLLPVPFVVGIAYYFQHRLAKLYQNIRQTAANLAGHVSYRLQGLLTIKSFVTESYELNLLDQRSQSYQTASYQVDRINALYIPLVRMAVMAGFIASLVVGGAYVLQGAIPINWYAALVFLTQRFLWPFTSLANLTDLYEKSLACSKRVVGILQTSNQIQSGVHSLPLEAITGQVSFKKVNFAYSNQVPVLQDLSLDIPARQTVGFVGATGSGKSTIIKLLLRFYDLQSGQILIDGQDITNLQLDDLRRSIALVGQEVYLVEGTIADNIAYGSFQATRAQVVAAAQMAQAHDFIMSLPDGYDTILQEHGKNLSGGQRQRLAIARAILKGSPIFIFDEATSAIDNETEAAIQESMEQLRGQHTIIVIAHRLSAVRTADLIYVLDHGQVVEAGKHEGLLAKNGAYAKLWKA